MRWEARIRTPPPACHLAQAWLQRGGPVERALCSVRSEPLSIPTLPCVTVTLAGFLAQRNTLSPHSSPQQPILRGRNPAQRPLEQHISEAEIPSHLSGVRKGQAPAPFHGGMEATSVFLSWESVGRGRRGASLALESELQHPVKL